MEIRVEQIETPEPATFMLGAGDELSINVWRNDNLSRTIKIDPSGMIQFPLVGTIQAAGLTTAHLENMLTARLSKYLVNPQVDINAKSLISQKAYIMGEVNTPGVILLDHPVLFWEALARSGGFTNDANQKNILLIRQYQDIVRISVLNLDIAMQIDKGQFIMESYLRNNDILYVPTSSIADFERFMRRLSNIIAPILGIEQAFILTPELIKALKGREISGSIVVSH